ncbi:MAG: hypothetical protein LW709_02770 [Oxalobacteraceae bacterium]|jgi:hypothetical protein|nr:hypothetical protein [Oxalobacteraceae bacterium]MCE2830982.1 hypothetical protein [Oxalobacteraceae bacterium]
MSDCKLLEQALEILERDSKETILGHKPHMIVAAFVHAVENEKLLATFQKLRDESHTIVGASDDYKQGREMGIQLCINELIRGEK